MSENLHRIDKLFKDALDDHEEQPSSDLWDQLDRSLDAKSLTEIRQKNKRLKWVAAASLIFAFFFGMYTIYTPQHNEDAAKKSGVLNDISKEKQLATTNQIAPSIKEKGSSINETNLSKDNDQLSQSKSSALSGANSSGRNSALTFTSQNKVSQGIQNIPTQKDKTQYSNAIEVNNPSTRNAVVLQSNPGTTSKSPLLNSSSAQKPDVNASEFNIAYRREDALTDIAVEDSKKLSLNSASSPNQLISKPVGASSPSSEVSASKKQRISKASPFSLSVFFAPELIRNRVVSDKTVFKEDDKREITRSEKTGFSSTVGVLINYSLSKNWTLQSGLTFSNTAKKIERKHIYARPDSRGNVRYRFNCTAGYSYIDVKSGIIPSSGDSLFAINSTNSLQYIGVPLSIQYSFTKSKWSIAPTLGVSTNILTKGQIETVVATGTANERSRTRDIKGLKTIYFSGIAGVGVNYAISKKLSVNINPQARFALNPINKEGPVKTYKKSFGLAGGLSLAL